MTLIEGIGDEVIEFFTALLVVLIITIAWWTTNISEQRHIRTVLLVDRRERFHRRLTNHTESVTISEGEPRRETEPEAVTAEAPSSSSSEPIVNIAEEEEQHSIIETMDADNCFLRQRRLAFYAQNSADNNERIEEVPEAESSQSPKTKEEEAEAQEETKEETPVDPNSISIKLKYINDDLKLVKGSLDEKLVDFKQRNFTEELSSNKIVKLIFNGQVLQHDTKILRDFGLFDQCVVHCLIHQKRQTTSNITNPTRNSREETNQERDWDLGNVLLALITFSLLVAWYFRYVYAHWYNVTSTVGLVFMTALFSVVIIGMYFPEHENLQPSTVRIQPQPVQQQ